MNTQLTNKENLIYIPKYSHGTNRCQEVCPKRKFLAEKSQECTKIPSVQECVQPGKDMPTFCFPSSKRYLRNRAEESHTNLKNFYFPGEIVYITTPHEAENAVQEILNSRPSAVGLDLEWRVIFQAGQPPRRTSTIQLCVSAKISYVIQVFHSGWPPSIVKLLCDPNIIKVGVNIVGDFCRISSEGICKYSDIKGIGELTQIARTKILPNQLSNSDYSLQGLTARLLDRNLLKPQHIRVGNWEVKPLDPEQLIYAATDAYASLRVYEELLKVPEQSKKPSLVLIGAEDLETQESSTNDHFETLLSGPDEMILAVPGLPKPLSASKQDVYHLFHKEKMTVPEIAAAKGIQVSTVHNYLTEAIESGREYNWGQFAIPKQTQKIVLEAWTKNKQAPLKTLKESLPNDIEYWQIKLCIVHQGRLLVHKNSTSVFSIQTNENEPVKTILALDNLQGIDYTPVKKQEAKGGITRDDECGNKYYCFFTSSSDLEEIERELGPLTQLN